ncbi:MAG: aminotransferase class III-fold pyridoxal phosphate-dependent enzyme [Bacteriovoracaceae bacterium]
MFQTQVLGNPVCDGPFLNDKQILQAATFLVAGGSPELLSEKVLMTLAEIGKTSVDKLSNEKVLNKILSKLVSGKNNSLASEVAGEQIAAAKNVLIKSDPDLNRLYTNDVEDGLKGWGWELLPKNDKAFNDPEFLAKLVKQSDAVGVGSSMMDPSHADRFFRDEFKLLTKDKLYIETFARTGSDANNYFYEIANKVVSNRLKKKVEDAEVLVFSGSYGGVIGKIADKGMLRGGYTPYNIQSPHTAHFEPTDAMEISRLEELEKKSLNEIREKFESSEHPIGGILLEPILGARGVLFYRTEFLLELRKLCDELEIPILADEVLTGGGRTGKFFAFEHYEGFEPDYVTFGKGLQVSGLASYTRKKSPYFPGFNLGPVTSQASPDSLLKGAQVLKRIRTDKLMENAEQTGEYLLKKLQELSNKTSPEEIRGKGLMLYTDVISNRYLGIGGAFGRITPPLTLTPKQIDDLASKKLNE